MKLQNLKVGHRLALVMAAILCLSGAMLAGALYQLDRISAAKTIMASASDQAILAQHWLNGTATNGVRTVARIKSTSPEDEQYYASEMKRVSAEIDKVQKRLEALIDSARGKELVAAVAANRKSYLAMRDEAYRRKAEAGGDPATIAPFVTGQVLPALSRYVQSVQAVAAYQESLSDVAQAHIDDLNRTARWFMAIVGLIALGSSALFGYLLTRSITTPLHRAVGLAEQVAAGDLTAHIEVNRSDEVGTLLGALKRMSDNLRQTVTEVRAGTESIVTASQQIASGNQDLSARTEQQAASLEETASSMEELTSTVRQNAEHADRARSQALATAALAEQGGEAVQRVIATMGSISESSREIGQIIAVIDGIAFQTNILALNAAVEAARAGEQGRGFAVVASEVRNLAQRSAGAAKEIRTLITGTMDKVNDGTRLVDGAGSSMQDIVAGIRTVTELVTEIAAANAEQSAGIEQVNTAVIQMDGVTQQNAALVEEAAAAATSMHHHAQALADVVSTFRLNQAPVRRRTPAGSAAAHLRSPRPALAA
ncbi:HAMP domain-containing protein [Massilia arenosa]|uniref:HAMP domain-containing protein n=1 Tax=Zemynaea arenosa TaxID=2561931 RepID=A0A4Y9SG26_9BURK|nr:methyl-accepting chemotaxis protein [Massilia arenosa]TFW19065.1 HAMP domain-containing protein [Massilia arenosa]